MAMVKITCKGCGRQFRVPDDGQEAKCPYCDTVNRIPSLAERERDQRLSDLENELKNVMDQLHVLLSEKEQDSGSGEQLVTISIVKDQVTYVPQRMLHELYEADQELAVALGVFSLFLGTLLPDIVHGSFSTYSFSSLLFTIVSGGFVYYYFRKADRHKKSIKQQSEEFSVEQKILTRK